MKKFWQHSITHFINYISLHLFLMLVSLPLIVAWGLPSSWLSPIGNFIFNPFISLFLFVSSVAFFSELLGIPHAACNWLLEQLTAWWHWLLSWAPKNVLYGFHGAPWWLLLTLSLIAFASVMHPWMKRPVHRLSGFTILFLISMAILRAHEPSCLVYCMPCHHGSITIIRAHNTTIVIDPGYIGSRLSASSWISYTFMPELIAHTGSLTIDHLIFLKPTTMTCTAITTLLDVATVNHIYIPTMQGELTGSFKRSFNKLYAHIHQDNIPITRLYNKLLQLPMGNLAITITPQGTKKYQTIAYPQFTLTTCVDTMPITITSR